VIPHPVALTAVAPEGVWEQGAEENIWTKEGRNGGRMENTS